MLNFENLDEKFVRIVNSSQWKELQEKFNNCPDIYVLGHGGNLAVADHAAVDITRLSNGTKNAMCPGSAVVATSLINDTSFDQWMVAWLQQRTSTRTKGQMKKSLVYGISSSGTSKDVIKALQWASDNGMETCLLTAKPIPGKIKGLTQVLLGVDYYHTAECLSLLLQYQLTHGSGKECPPIGQNSPEELEKLNWNKGIRKHSYPDEEINLGIDFDGVIHNNDKGFYDGTIYGDPIEGTEDALKTLADKYTLICYTAKAKPDRMLINGKTGTELVWEWLKKHKFDKYISKVTSEKPRAVAYIDDKAIRFSNWDHCLASLESAIAAEELISAFTITPDAILNTPALVNPTSPLGTTGLKLVPSATMIAVSVLVPIVKSSPEIVKSPVTTTLPPNVALPASDISKVKAVTSEPPSLPLIYKSLSDTLVCIVTSLDELNIRRTSVPSSS